MTSKKYRCPNGSRRKPPKTGICVKKTGAKAKVALHHRRNTIPSELKCFECIKDNTISLIKDSKFVLTHNSTAVNFAILFKKPITLIQYL